MERERSPRNVCDVQARTDVVTSAAVSSMQHTNYSGSDWPATFREVITGRIEGTVQYDLMYEQ